MNNIKIIFKIVVLSGLLTSCTVKKINIDNKILKQNQAIYQNLNNWHLKGKISWHHKPTKNFAVCYIDWQKNNNKSDIIFRSAMNIKSISIQLDNGKFKILNNNQAQAATKDIEDISKSIQLNISNLNYWLLGVPAKGAKYSLIENGFRQQGWEVIYDQYKTYNNFILPTKIIMKNFKSQTIIKVAISSINVLESNRAY